MNMQSDTYYITKVQAGDTKAFAELVNKHKTRVFSVAYQIVRNREDAEEVSQDAFLKVYQGLRQFRGDAKFTSWMYRIVYNTAISKVRRKTPEQSPINEEVLNNFTLDDIFENLNQQDEAQQKQLINNMMEQLTPEDRGLISLYYFDDRSIDEIAFIRNLSASNVKVKLFRIRKKMHHYLENVLSSELKEIYT